MEIRIKSEKEIYSTGIPCSPPKNILSSSPSASQTNSTITHNSGTNMALVKESQQPELAPKRQDVSSNRTSPLQNMPAIDLRIVKKERIDEDELEVQENPRRSPTRESNGVLHRGSTLIEQEMQSPEINSGRDSMAFVSVPPTQDEGRANKEDEEDENSINRSRYAKSIETYPYRVPIVYPIHSPPIDYRSINTAGRSPSPNNYRLEEEEKKSPMLNQRKLYEEAHWPSMEDRQEVEFQENHSSGCTGCKSARNSPARQDRPLNCGNQNQERVKEGSTSPKEPTNSFNSGKATFNRRRGKNSERLTSAEDDKEEESLWKQVQRYRHRKRPALGKLYPTQEETIFMQYNEIRERRHREGRIITRTGRPVMSHCNSNIEPSRTPPADSADDQADSKIQAIKQTGPPKPCGMDSFGGQGSRGLGLEFPKSKALANSCISGPSHELQRSPTISSTSMDSHQAGSLDGNTERKKSQDEHLETHVQDYQSYSSPNAHSCTGQNSQLYCDIRGRDGRGTDARSASHATVNRRNQSYEESCHSASPHRTHRTIQPPRFHLEHPGCYENSCHGNRRRLSTCGHQCCNHIRAQYTSCDNADDFDNDNDESNHWQYSPKEKRSRTEQDSRDVNDLYRIDDQPRLTPNDSRPFSPSSSDSRDNESIENGPTQDFQTENEEKMYENGHVSQGGSPQMPHSESDGRFPQTSSFPLEREPDDDDIICHVNGLFSLPGYRETKYDITRGELKRRTEPPETLTRVEMISYVRQAKTSGRILLDTNGITTSNRSHPTILSRVCEREAQVLACGIHKMNLEYLPLKKLVQICVDMYKSRGCDGCQDCRLKLRRRIVDVEITRNMLKELLHVFQEASTVGFLDSFELASHTFGTMNVVNNIKMIDEYYKLLLLALEKE